MNNKSKKIKLPFIMDGGKKSNIFNEKQLDLTFKLKNIGLFNVINKLTTNDNSKINIMKASETKDYYKKLNKNNNK